jgi:hypothetical protein
MKLWYKFVKWLDAILLSKLPNWAAQMVAIGVLLGIMFVFFAIVDFLISLIPEGIPVHPLVVVIGIPLSFFIIIATHFWMKNKNL